MCKIHSAIYELSKHAKSDILVCSTGHLHIEGKLHKCNWVEGENKCYDEVVTLTDALVTTDNEYKKEYKWINIPTKRINAFAFKNS